MRIKKKKVFELPYIGYDDKENFSILYGEKGNPIVVFKVDNPVLEMSADIDYYNQSHDLFVKVVKTLGEGFLIQKIDLINRKEYNSPQEDDALLDSYQRHFEGRIYKDLSTYVCITHSFIESRKIAKYNKKEDEAFFNKIDKIYQIFKEGDMNPALLNKSEIETWVARFLTFNFDDKKHLYRENILPDATHIRIGDKYIKSLTPIDTELMGVPSMVSPVSIEGGNDLNNDVGAYPVDGMKFLFDCEDYDTLIYNQVIEVGKQTKIIRELESKKNRSMSVPDPSNALGVEDIDTILEDVARENQLLVRGHFNILLGCSSQDKLTKAVNFFESNLFSKGFLVAKNSFNQMELFRSCLLGNANELKYYDMFITSSDSAVCFFFKEKRVKDELSDYFVYFTDRQGIPVKIDPEDLPKNTGRISNMNKFVLGPSGSGKSFFMNALISMLMRYNMDIVVIDTGNSYIGTCDFFGGKYITYEEDKPITMNPFRITKEERNLEKMEFLSTLILLIFKDKGTSTTQDEYDLIADCLDEYYKRYFDFNENWYKEKTTEELVDYLEKKGYTYYTDFQYTKQDSDSKRIQSSKIMSYYAMLDVEENAEWDVVKKAYRDLAKKYHPDTKEIGVEDDKFKEISRAYEELEKMETAKKRTQTNRFEIVRYVREIDKKLKVDSLSFNSFYEFSCSFLPMVLKGAKLKDFNFEKYQYVLKKFYKGGRFDTILNEEADKQLLDERMIVFEIDNVKDNPTLFPIVTLVIMDIFLQKMRLRDTMRKALIIEEAWKAIANELMGGYIVYLYKTVRKFWGQCIVVTQELGDIIDNPVVKDSIISNSDSLILLDQTKFKDNFDKVANLLSLNSIEQSKIFTINQMDNKQNRNPFKEFYFKRGAVGEVYGNEVSMMQYLAFTTEKPEKNAVFIYKSKYGDYIEGIKKFLSDMEYVGLGLKEFVKLINKLECVPDDSIKEELHEKNVGVIKIKAS